MGTKPQSPALAECLPPEKGSTAERGVLEFRAHRCVSKGRGTGAGSAVRTSGPLQQFIPGHSPALSAEAGTAGSDNRATINGQVHQQTPISPRKPDCLLLGNLIQKAEEKAAPPGNLTGAHRGAGSGMRTWRQPSADAGVTQPAEVRSPQDRFGGWGRADGRGRLLCMRKHRGGKRFRGWRKRMGSFEQLLRGEKDSWETFRKHCLSQVVQW